MKATVYKVAWFNKEKKQVITHRQEIELPSDTERRLKALQKLVGGWIDIYHHKGDDLVINDEGYILEEPLNNWAFDQGLNLFGTIVRIHGQLPG